MNDLCYPLHITNISQRNKFVKIVCNIYEFSDKICIFGIGRNHLTARRHDNKISRTWPADLSFSVSSSSASKARFLCPSANFWKRVWNKCLKAFRLNNSCYRFIRHSPSISKGLSQIIKFRSHKIGSWFIDTRFLTSSQTFDKFRVRVRDSQLIRIYLTSTTIASQCLHLKQIQKSKTKPCPTQWMDFCGCNAKPDQWIRKVGFEIKCWANHSFFPFSSVADLIMRVLMLIRNISPWNTKVSCQRRSIQPKEWERLHWPHFREVKHMLNNGTN